MRRDQHGFTLIELLVTIVIMGAAFIVLVGGTLVGVQTSSAHREKADGEIVLRRFIDHVKAAAFQACPGTQYKPDSTDPEYEEYWAEALENFSLAIGPDVVPDNPEAYEDGCVTLEDGRLQRLTLVVEAADAGERSRQSVQILKRKHTP